ncbi:DoxX family membrane protein [Angustibacter peucedani]
MTPGRGRWLWLATALRLVLGGVLVVAGALKLPDPAVSVRAVRAYQLLPEGVVPAVGHGLPLLEIAVGALLLLGFATRFAAVVGGLLMVAFIIGIVSAGVRGLTIDCGCFGGGGQVSANNTKYTQEVVRDALLLVAAAYLVRWPASRLSLDPTPLADKELPA